MNSKGRKFSYVQFNTQLFYFQQFHFNVFDVHTIISAQILHFLSNDLFAELLGFFASSSEPIITSV